MGRREIGLSQGETGLFGPPYGIKVFLSPPPIASEFLEALRATSFLPYFTGCKRFNRTVGAKSKCRL